MRSQIVHLSALCKRHAILLVVYARPLRRTRALACVAGGIRERASGGGAAITSRASRGISRAAKRRVSGIQLGSSPILSRPRHSLSLLRYQNKSSHARNPASYAGYTCVVCAHELGHITFQNNLVIPGPLNKDWIQGCIPVRLQS